MPQYHFKPYIFYILALIGGIEISKVIGEPKTEVILTSNPLLNGYYNVSRGFVYGHIWSIVYQAYRVVSFLSCRSFMWMSYQFQFLSQEMSVDGSKPYNVKYVNERMEGVVSQG